MEITQEWIDNFNRKCAEFLGIITSSGYWVEFDKIMPSYITISYSKRHHIEQLCFHSDWNWIMEVVEKIENTLITEVENTEPIVCIRLVGCDIKFFSNERLPIITNSKSKKEAVIKAIDQFIDWYNKQKENETEIN